jgi:hypothetical protein
MARTVTEIQQEIFANIISNDDLAILNSTSKVAIYRLLVFVVSFAVWTLEKLFDIHSSQVDEAIYNQKSGTPRWYRNMSLHFQFGFNLLTDDDQFDNIGFTNDQIEASKIIKYCSVKESLESSRLIIKIAGESGDNLIPLTPTQITSFQYYMSEVAYAGVKLNIVNNPADKLSLTMRVYRNPLVIDELGNNILIGGKSVELAIKQYIKNLPFDGELVINDMIDYLRDVDGVENVHIISAQSSYKDLVTGLYKPFVTIDVKTIPVAGYFEVENFNKIDYDKLGLLLLPTFLRKPKMIAFVITVFSPIKSLHYKWLQKRDFDWYRLTHTDQVCKLRKVLNDNLDPSLRRIYLGVGTAFPRQYIYTESENKPKYLGNFFIKSQNEYENTGVDFIVFVPTEIINASIYQLKYLLNYYKLAGKRYNIEPII